MNDQKQKIPKPPWPVVLVGAIALFFILTHIIPWQVLAFIAFLVIILLAFLVHLAQEAAKEKSAAIPQYQPPQKQSPEPEPARATLKPGFHLTAEEYRQLSKQYRQGYQAQVPQQPPTSAEPKEESPWNYDQPQAQYPQQMPPMA